MSLIRCTAISTATSIGPYQLIGRNLHDKNGCQVCATMHPALPGLWAIKVKADNHYEIQWIEPLLGHNIRACVAFPPLDSGVPIAGTLESGREWFAMRAYDACVDNNAWCRDRWKQIGLTVLDFLEDLHTKMRAAHLDIKTYNILVDKQHETFHVCDFEHMTHADDFEIDEPLRNYNNECKWYYVMLGGELDQPFESWRLDLEALGFVLACLTWRSGVSIGFATECRERMAGRGTQSMTDEEVVVMREHETATYADPLVSAYLGLVSTVSWTQADPPPPAFYESLRDLLGT